MCNDKYIKIKLNLYNGKLTTNIHCNKIPEENECYACFSVLLLDSVVKVGKNCYTQTLLEECKYAFKLQNIILSCALL